MPSKQKKPRVLITRPLAEAGEMAALLAPLGWETILFPVTRVLELTPLATLTEALARLEGYDWILFTSQRAVDIFSREYQNHIPKNPFPKSVQVAAVGPTTARRLKDLDFPVHLVPENHVAEGLLESLGKVSQKKILLPRSREGRDLLSKELTRRGAGVTEIFLYTMEEIEPDPEAMEQARRGFDAVVSASPSAVKAFLKIAMREKWDLTRIPFAVIGAITRAELENHGSFKVQVAAEATLNGLVDAVSLLKPDI